MYGVQCYDAVGEDRFWGGKNGLKNGFSSGKKFWSGIFKKFFSPSSRNNLWRPFPVSKSGQHVSLFFPAMCQKKVEKMGFFEDTCVQTFPRSNPPWYNTRFGKYNTRCGKHKTPGFMFTNRLFFRTRVTPVLGVHVTPVFKIQTSFFRNYFLSVYNRCL